MVYIESQNEIQNWLITCQSGVIHQWFGRLFPPLLDFKAILKDDALNNNIFTNFNTNKYKLLTKLEIFKQNLPTKQHIFILLK